MRDRGIRVRQIPEDRQSRSGRNDLGITAWHERAVCAQTDPEFFFPDKDDPAYAAKQICAVCTVRRECLDFALNHGQRFGVWGGLSPQERLDLLTL